MADHTEDIVGRPTREAVLLARIAELEAALARERYRATRDPLTGLLNRNGLEDAWQVHSRTPGYRLALIDLDGFKQVNDLYGHAAGDELLRAMASWMRALPAATRLGGDEFVALIVTVGELPTTVTVTLDSGETIGAGLSVGLAAAEGDLYEALARADAAMYAAKTRGAHYEQWSPYRHDRPQITPRPRQRLRDDAALVVRDSARGAA